jgi:UDP-N-acetylmuramoylalanine--D-glutamate ligase
MERYTEIKARAVSFMEPDDHAVLNFDDPTVRVMSRQTQGHLMPFAIAGSIADAGVTVESGWIVIRASGNDRRIMPVAQVPLPGAHNLSNVLAAVAAGASAGVAGERMAHAVAEFKGVEHRLELIGTFRGVRWYNDSKATNPDSTYKALDAFTDPLVLIAGGRNKGLDVAPLAKAIARRATALIAIGETADELVQLARKEGLTSSVLATDLADAVRRAAATATPGSVVLLSPGFTSFDMFRDYEDRGRRFKAAVLKEVGA